MFTMQQLCSDFYSAQAVARADQERVAERERQAAAASAAVAEFKRGQMEMFQQLLRR